jgi:Peptidase S24-like
MKTELVEIIRGLRIIEKPPIAEMAELRDHVLKAFGDPPRAKEIIDELKHRRNSYDDMPFCDLFMAFAYYESGKEKDNSNAIKYTIKATEGFKISGQRLNAALAHWMLGVLYYDTKDEQKGPGELQSAVDILLDLIKESRSSGKYEESQKIYEFLLKRLGWTISLPYRTQSNHTSNEDVVEVEFKKKHAEESGEAGGYLSLSWLPISSKVTAGKDGPIWATPPKNAIRTEIDQIVLGNNRYAIFSVTQGDKRIVFSSDKRYGWAEVEGNSMNADKPTPIEEMDMVLYYKAEDATGNSLVIASIPDEKGAGFKYMVKRWDAGNNQFISHSNQPGFKPIPRDADHTIIGIVSAIAKPIVKG